MQILKRTFAAVLFVAATAGAASAQKTPDFSGQWELNVAKSDFGPMAQAAPTKATMTVTQSGTTLKLVQAVSSPMGDQNNTQDLTIDGQEHAVTGGDGQPTATTVKADGEAIVMNTKMSRQGMDITMNSRWSLSPDGKLLTVDRQIGTPQGALAMKLVYEKK